MQDVDVKDKQQILLQTIVELSTDLLSDEENSEVIEVVETLYRLYFDSEGRPTGFRHSYSDFFALITEISKERDIQCLSNNLERIRSYVELDSLQERVYGDLYRYLFKLCDHLNLEIARLEYYTKIENGMTQAVRTLQKVKQDTDQAVSGLMEAQDKLKTTQNEIVAVLSIFSAVVIAFFGGINFICSAISSIQGSHIFKSTMIVLIAGLILFNCIFLLLFLVSRIIERDIYVKCKKKTQNYCNGKCGDFAVIRNRMPYVFWTNAMILFLLVTTCAIWICVGADIT